MRALGKIDGVYVFAVRKNEDLGTAMDRISDAMPDCELTCKCVRGESDVSANGFKPLVDRLAEKVDFDKYSLALVKKVS